MGERLHLYFEIFMKQNEMVDYWKREHHKRLETSPVLSINSSKSVRLFLILDRKNLIFIKRANKWILINGFQDLLIRLRHSHSLDFPHCINSMLNFSHNWMEIRTGIRKSKKSYSWSFVFRTLPLPLPIFDIVFLVLKDKSTPF